MLNCLRFLLIATLAMGLGFTSFGQQNEYRISGQVKDNYNEVLEMAAVRLNNSADSLLVGVITDANGNFAITGVHPGTYKLIIQYTSFADNVRTLEVTDQDIDLGLIKMEVKSNELQAVTVTAHLQAVEQNGDTTSYNAGAYKVNKDATAGDLIGKILGWILVRDNRPPRVKL